MDRCLIDLHASNDRGNIIVKRLEMIINHIRRYINRKYYYYYIEGCVINNGFSSITFLLQCGVRQGCPMSPYLFIIVADILAIMIRQDKHFENIEMKISQYADDTVLYLQPNEPNLRHCFSILDQFNCMSGLKIIVEKCNVIRLGSFNDTLCQDKPLSWPSDKVLFWV